MNEELDKRLAEWVGFVYCGCPGGGYFWMRPDGGHSPEYPIFTNSLDACFKWLVPKYIAEVCVLPMGLTSIMSIYAFLFAEWLKVMQEKVEPALALCLAIEKLIDKEETNGITKQGRNTNQATNPAPGRND